MQHRVAISYRSKYRSKYRDIDVKSYMSRSAKSSFKHKLSMILIFMLIILSFNESNPFEKSNNIKLSINFKKVGIGAGNNFENTYSRVTQNRNNKLNHILNGNRTKNIGLNIIQINKGNSYFEKKIDSMQRIIKNENPDIICISESNIRKSKINDFNYFPGLNH